MPNLIVRDLINHLQNLDQDAVIAVPSGNADRYHFCSGVRDFRAQVIREDPSVGVIRSAGNLAKTEKTVFNAITFTI